MIDVPCSWTEILTVHNRVETGEAHMIATENNDIPNDAIRIYHFFLLKHGKSGSTVR